MYLSHGVEIAERSRKGERLIDMGFSPDKWKGGLCGS